jgi:hypothetical protein
MENDLRELKVKRQKMIKSNWIFLGGSKFSGDY